MIPIMSSLKQAKLIHSVISQDSVYPWEWQLLEKGTEEGFSGAGNFLIWVLLIQVYSGFEESTKNVHLRYAFVCLS